MTPIDARPFPFALDFDRSALVIIDMQRDFVEPGGFGESLGNRVEPLQEIIPTVQRLLATWRARGGCVVHTRESHLPDLSDCPAAKRDRGQPRLRIGDHGPMGRILVRGEPGNQIVPALQPQGEEIVIDKPGKGAFYNTDLMAQLQRRGITQLVVTGVTTEVCVQTTLREANDRGFDCLLIEDATASYFPNFKQATIDMVIAQGAIVGWACLADPLIQGLEA
jgi:nicotinamidase-related amidase